MSGHNKWSKIKRKKEATDAQKSKIFTKYAKLIQVESKKAKGDINAPGLASVIERARKENMPKENIERAISKGAGGDSGNLEQITYEMYGPAGIALMIEVLTDNRNRIVAEIKHLVSKRGYELATPGSAAWAFRREGTEWIPETTVPIGEEDSGKLNDLIESLEDHDDVQGVFVNAEE